MAPVYLAVKASSDMEAILLSTAQHRQLLDQVLSVFGIEPDVDLKLMSPIEGLSEISAKILTETQKVLSSLKPDAILVHGDTATCLFSALAAFYERIPTGHVEAGLRTYDFNAPWPEEMNRRLADPVCRWCFAPTERARQICSEKAYLSSRFMLPATRRWMVCFWGWKNWAAGLRRFRIGAGVSGWKTSDSGDRSSAREFRRSDGADLPGIPADC
jgi:UDP-N-acetylglucosamine 2-epimerase